jgi:type VI secretion system protein ImpK
MAESERGRKTVSSGQLVDPVRSAPITEGSTALVTLILSEVAAVARTGQLSEAESILNRLSGEEQTAPPAAHLLARIRAQQGRLAEAKTLWAQLSTTDPNNKTYRSALKRIAILQRRPRWVTSLLSFLPAAAIVAVCFLAVLFALGRRPETSRKAESIAVSRHSETAKEVAMAAGPWEPPPIQLPGIEVHKTGADMTLTFGDGLFLHGSQLRPDAKRRLTEFGRQLAPFAGSISIVVAGCSDNIPMRRHSGYENEAALRIARAFSVFQHLKRTAGLPERLFSLQDSPAAPYQNNSSVNQARNRTVVIHIYPARG